MATHSSILAWKIPWEEEPGGLQSIGSQRVRHNWNSLACAHTALQTGLTSLLEKLSPCHWVLGPDPAVILSFLTPLRSELHVSFRGLVPDFKLSQLSNGIENPNLWVIGKKINYISLGLPSVTFFFFFITAAAELPSKLYWVQVIKVAFNSLSRHSDRQPGRAPEALGCFLLPF